MMRGTQRDRPDGSLFLASEYGKGSDGTWYACPPQATSEAFSAFQLAALVVWVEMDRWYGYVVFDDMRLSPLHPHLAIPLLYELYPSESVETQLERARAHWLALCDVFRALMTPKGGNYGEATRPD